MNIAVLIGSLRRASFNRALAGALGPLAPAGTTLTPLRIDDLPLYNQDLEETPAPPVSRLKQEIASAAGVIFVTPEYNRSIPGVLKNAIDHASRPYGKSAWSGKPAGVLGISVGAAGTSMAQQHLRNVLTYLDMPTLQQPEMYLGQVGDWFDADGKVKSADTRAFLGTFARKFVDWIELTAPRAQVSQAA